jgi:TonB family protein
VAAPEPAPARPEPKPKDTIPEPASKPVKTPIAKSTTRVVRQGGAARRPTLSPEEIRRLLDLGATPGDRTIIPSEEQMCLEMIRRRFYESWAQPSAVEMGNSVVEVDIRLGPAGQVTGRRLVSGSGKPAVDASVMEAANAVSFIPGLTPAFLRRYPSVIVAFRLQ